MGHVVPTFEQLILITLIGSWLLTSFHKLYSPAPKEKCCFIPLLLTSHTLVLSWSRTIPNNRLLPRTNLIHIRHLRSLVIPNTIFLMHYIKNSIYLIDFFYLMFKLPVFWFKIDAVEMIDFQNIFRPMYKYSRFYEILRSNRSSSLFHLHIKFSEFISYSWVPNFYWQIFFSLF